MSRPRVTNAGDKRQVRRALRTDREQADRLRDALRVTLMQPNGRMLIWGLLARFGMYESTFSSDPLEMARRAGRQDCAHELLADVLSADESLYLLMEQEARAWMRRDDAVAQRETEGQNDGEDSED